MNRQQLLLVDENNYLAACAAERGEIRLLAHSLCWSEDDLEQFAREMFLCSFVGLSFRELQAMRIYFEEKKQGVAR